MPASVSRDRAPARDDCQIPLKIPGHLPAEITPEVFCTQTRNPTSAVQTTSDIDTGGTAPCRANVRYPYTQRIENRQGGHRWRAQPVCAPTARLLSLAPSSTSQQAAPPSATKQLAVLTLIGCHNAGLPAPPVCSISSPNTPHRAAARPPYVLAALIIELRQRSVPDPEQAAQHLLPDRFALTPRRDSGRVEAIARMLGTSTEQACR
jgi:hypothetical protein